jgi:hypothetical protein
LPLVKQKRIAERLKTNTLGRALRLLDSANQVIVRSNNSDSVRKVAVAKEPSNSDEARNNVFTFPQGARRK